MKSVFIKTLGCEKNTVDSECVAALFEKQACIITEDPLKADFLLVITCGFILDAKTQSIDSIFDLINIKTDRQKLIVSGCLSQRYIKELQKEIPEVDYWLGVDNYDKIEAILQGSCEKNFVTEPSKVFCELPRKITNSYTASLKIAEGCPNICSYCAIPLMKGKYRSRASENVIGEASALAKSGVKELIIIAQDVTFYGRDIKGGDKLPELLHKLCKIEGIEWIRLMYCYEDEITDDLIQCMKNEPKICKYIDIPIQHVSNKILKAMNRKSTYESITNTIRKLRSEIPGVVIRTTLMVGFPTEIDEDFKQLLKFQKEFNIDRLGCFAYSKEEGTKSASLHRQVAESVKQRRKDRIMETQRAISLANNQMQVGKVFRVLIDSIDDTGVYIGRTYMDAPDIDNEVIFKGPTGLKPGMFVNVKILDAFDYDLSGEMINEI